MDYAEIRRRLSLIHSIWTPKKKNRNVIHRLDEDTITVQSDESGSQLRNIMFRDILEGTTATNSHIIHTLRTISGLPHQDYCPAHPDKNCFARE